MTVLTVGGGAVRHCYFSSPTLTLLIWSFVSEPFPLSLEPVACSRLMAGAVLCQLQPCVHYSVCPGLRSPPSGGLLEGELWMQCLWLSWGCGNNGTRQQIGSAALLRILRFSMGRIGLNNLASVFNRLPQSPLISPGPGHGDWIIN